jgi:hypothetical protein
MFNTHFSYIVAVSFIGGGNWGKPLTFLKSQDKIYSTNLPQVSRQNLSHDNSILTRIYQ